MVEVSDETLMAYADGELDAAGRAELDAILPDRPDLLARIELFRRTRSDVQKPFESFLKDPVPAALVASIRSAPISGSNVEPFRRPSTSRVSNGTPRAATVWKYSAIAASIGLLVGCASGWYAGASTKASVTGGDVLASAGISARGAVRTALETGSSGVAATIAAGGGADTRITPVATFHSKDQRFCRQYEIASTVRYEGVACRNAAGAWDIVYHGKAAAKGAPGGLIPAAGSKRAIDAAIDEIIDGGVLEASEEQIAIKDGWKRPG